MEIFICFSKQNKVLGVKIYLLKSTIYYEFSVIRGATSYNPKFKRILKNLGLFVFIKIIYKFFYSLNFYIPDSDFKIEELLQLQDRM